MFRAFITAYPWDLVEADLDPMLDHLRGAIGISGLSLWVACPPLVQVRTRRSEQRVFSTQGGLFFHAASEHFAGRDGTCITSRWLGDRRPLLRIREACGHRGLKLRLRISAADTGRVARSFPELACRNAFGGLSQRSICLANPAAHAYLTSLVTDLSASHDLAALVLADVYIGWTEAYAPALQIGVDPNDVERGLLATCFCESCVQRASAAGVDAVAVRKEVRDHLEEFLDEAPREVGSMERRTSEAGSLTNYHRWQSLELDTLLDRLKASCECVLLVERYPKRSSHTHFVEPDDAHAAGIISYVGATDQLEAAWRPHAARNEVRFGSALASGSRGEDLVRIMPEVVERGFSAVEFDNYGLLSDAGLAVVRRAIRYARRTGTA